MLRGKAGCLFPITFYGYCQMRFRTRGGRLILEGPCLLVCPGNHHLRVTGDLTNSSRPGEGLLLAVVLSGTQISFCCPLFALRLLAFHCSLPPVGRCRSHFVSFTSAFRAGRGDGGGANPSVPSAGKAFAFPETPELPGCQSFARRLLRGPQNERAGAGNAREVAREQSQLH